MPTTAAASVYRPRHPERTPLYRLFEERFEDFVRSYPERFEHRHGQLRPVVRRVVEQYLECGRLHGGFARLRCPSCHGEHLLAFSCQTRNFCPSCQAKRAALFAEHLAENVLADVPHRHVVFTIPKVLRPLFERERRLLSILTQSAHHCVQEILRHDTGDARAVVGTVASLQTFGGWFAANFHPHVHALITEGVFHDPRSATASFEWVAGWDVTAIAELFRRRVLARLRQARRLREHTEQMLLSWEHSGFSVWAGEPIRPGDTERQEHVARYVTRAPVRLDAIERKDQGKVLVQTPYDPRTGQRNLELDDLELIRRLCAQIPAPRQHLVRYFGWYSSRARGDRARRQSEESGNGAPRSEVRTDTEHRDDSPAARSRRRSWARLLRRIFEVDPLLCPQCGVEMKRVAVIQDLGVVDRILAHLRRIGGNDPWEGTAQRGPPASAPPA